MFYPGSEPELVAGMSEAGLAGHQRLLIQATLRAMHPGAHAGWSPGSVAQEAALRSTLPTGAGRGMETLSCLGGVGVVELLVQGG